MDMDMDTIPAVLIMYPGDIFSTLLTALDATDLVELLDGPGPFTVFAPTDEAYSRFRATLAAVWSDTNFRYNLPCRPARLPETKLS